MAKNTLELEVRISDLTVIKELIACLADNLDDLPLAVVEKLDRVYAWPSRVLETADA